MEQCGRKRDSASQGRVLTGIRKVHGGNSRDPQKDSNTGVVKKILNRDAGNINRGTENGDRQEKEPKGNATLSNRVSVRTWCRTCLGVDSSAH